MVISELKFSPRTLLERIIEDAIRSYGRTRRALIPLLQNIQENFGYLPKWSLEIVSNHLRVPISAIYGISTFYHQFNLEPQGEYVIQLCMGTACHINGNSENYAFLLKTLGLDEGRNTTEDGLFTVLKVRCLGCCSLAPVMKVNDDIYGKVNFRTIRKIISKYRVEAERKKVLRVQQRSGETYGNLGKPMAVDG
ncbi:NAD(P)H-dependent oxidoreductase subunit E [Candidatus Bathyarchaeota archaeon]|nr:NAD(P)H-dependent oxidoreductase subunit E [Candidatus Bathyarchaeota archaeon]